MKRYKQLLHQRYIAINIDLFRALADLSEYASELSKEDIADYLRDIKLGQYVETFKDNEVDGGMMYDMDATMLEEFLGVEIKGDRFKIMAKYKQWLRTKFRL